MRTTIENLGNGLELVKEFYYSGKVRRKYQTLNGKKHGEETWYYKNGKKEYVRNWVDGKLHGKEVFYRRNGQIEQECNYLNGKANGDEIWYYSNGQIELKRYRVDSCVVEEIWFNEDGSLAN